MASGSCGTQAPNISRSGSRWRTRPCGWRPPGKSFFSLSVGFGIVISTYASYLRKNDDIALSSLTAAAGRICEVVLGGGLLPCLPRLYSWVFLSGETPHLPRVRVRRPAERVHQMPAGQIMGFLFFFLLFLAAITSSLSMLQPAIALLEEGLGLQRKASVALLGFITAVARRSWCSSRRGCCAFIRSTFGSARSVLRAGDVPGAAVRLGSGGRSRTWKSWIAAEVPHPAWNEEHHQVRFAHVPAGDLRASDHNQFFGGAGEGGRTVWPITDRS